MQTHESWLTVIRKDLIRVDPICSILVVGSLGRGVSRPDSDIDMIAVTWCVETIPFALPWPKRHTHFGGEGGGIRLDTWSLPDETIKCLDLLLCSPAAYQERVLKSPVINWGSKKIIYDPSGIAFWGETCNRVFLRANPEVDKELAAWHMAYAAWKAAGRSFELKLERIQDLQARLLASAVAVEYKPFVAHVLQTVETSLNSKRNSNPPRRSRAGGVARKARKQ